MDDLISRQAAIDAIWEHVTRILETSDYDVFFQDVYKMAHRHIAELIEQLPSAQPDIKAAYEQGRIQGHVEMRTELLMSLKEIVGDEVWGNI